MAYRLAATSSHVTAVAVDAMEFSDLARRYQVTGVPKTVVNEVVEIVHLRFLIRFNKRTRM